jgi:isoleucyl-tRNA synthetase
VARDLVRAVQQARRDAGLDVSDRIVLTVSADASVADAARTHAELIRRETLAVTFEVNEANVTQPVVQLERA